MRGMCATEMGTVVFGLLSMDLIHWGNLEDVVRGGGGGAGVRTPRVGGDCRGITRQERGWQRVCCSVRDGAGWSGRMELAKVSNSM